MLVVPVVALVGNIVLHPVNAPAPEFVPLDVLASAPGGWNGRAVLPWHPEAKGTQVSANDPRTLEAESFGIIFNSASPEDVNAAGRLTLEAWLDPTKAARVGEKAQRAIERLQAGEIVEVSVGALVTVDDTPGTWQGKRFACSWTSIVPDHLAILGDGEIGACSVEAGCGALRNGRVYAVTAQGLIPASSEDDATFRAASAASCDSCGGTGLYTDGVNPCQSCHGSGVRDARAREIIFRDGSWCVMSAGGDRAISRHPTRGSAVEWKRSRRMLTEGEAIDEGTADVKSDKYLAFVGDGLVVRTAAAGPGEMTDEELREVLGEALKRQEPQFFRVASVTPAQSLCVYLIDPDPGGPMPLKAYQRTYAIGEDGRVAFNDDRQPVRPVQRWVPIAAKASDSAAGDCGCGGKHAATTAAQQETAMQRKDKIAALIANSNTPWSAADQQYLEGVSDERFGQIEADAKRVADAAAAQEQSTTELRTQLAAAQSEITSVKERLVAATATPTVEEYLQRAPQEIRDLVAAKQASDNARRTALVTKLSAAQAEFSADELTAMPMAQLDRIARLAKVDAVDSVPGNVDFSGQQIAPRALTNGVPAANEPPDPWQPHITRLQGQGQGRAQGEA